MAENLSIRAFERHSRITTALCLKLCSKISIMFD